MKSGLAWAVTSVILLLDVASQTAGHARTLDPMARANRPAADSLQTALGSVDVRGTRIAYATYGDVTAATPLLVLHGSLMSGADMKPLIDQFAAHRPVITIDARGHGLTGDVPGPITYAQMADDAVAVLGQLQVEKADVLGYSMGGTTAIVLAARHQALVAKLVIISAPAWRHGWYPEVQAGFEKWKPESFEGTAVERAYKKSSATPNAFAAVIDKLRELEKTKYDLPPQVVRSMRSKTMIVAGDNDLLDPSHALTLFKLRGGPDPNALSQGFSSIAPRARLAILPATSHVGMMSQSPLIAELVEPFLADRPPAPPTGFFAE